MINCSLPSFLKQIDATFCFEGYAVNLVDKKWYDDAMTFIAQLGRRGCAGKRPGNIDNSRSVYFLYCILSLMMFGKTKKTNEMIPVLIEQSIIRNE